MRVARSKEHVVSMVKSFELEVVEEFVSSIPCALKLLKDAEREGFRALSEWSLARKGVAVSNPCVPQEALEKAFFELKDDAATALKRAFDYSKWFHEATRPRDTIECTGSRIVWHPLNCVGIVLDKHSGPLLPQLIAACSAARAAGVKRVVVAVPESQCSKAEKRILLAAAYVCRAEVYLIEGAAAVVGLALGVEPLPSVEAIIGLGEPQTEASKAVVSGLVHTHINLRPPVHAVILGDGVDLGLVAEDVKALSSMARLVVVVSWSRDILKDLHGALPENAILVNVEGPREAGELIKAIRPGFLEVLGEGGEDVLPYMNAAAGYVALDRPVVASLYSMGLGTYVSSGIHSPPTPLTIYAFMKPIVVTKPTSPHTLWHVARLIAGAVGDSAVESSCEAWIRAWEKSRARGGRPLLIRRW